MAGKGKLKGLHLPLRAYIMYLLLICFALTGVTFSKYVTSTCGGDSARVAKIGSITVTENGELYNSDVIWRVAPGADITKNAVISFSGSELACYVFFETEVTGFERQADGTYCYKDSSGRVWLSWSFKESEWEHITVDGKDVYYKIAGANESIDESVMANGGLITVNPEITASELKNMPDNLSINIKACAVQYGGFESPEAAYRAVNK